MAFGRTGVPIRARNRGDWLASRQWHAGVTHIRTASPTKG